MRSVAVVTTRVGFTRVAELLVISSANKTAPANHCAGFLLRDPDRLNVTTTPPPTKLHVPDAVQSIYRIANGACAASVFASLISNSACSSGGCSVGLVVISHKSFSSEGIRLW